MTMATLTKKACNFELVYSFRCFVHYYHGREFVGRHGSREAAESFTSAP